MISRDVSTTGFEIVFETWSDTKIGRAAASWMAVGQTAESRVHALLNGANLTTDG
ncbi:H-type lectin domain-containing protein [Candidatus Rhodobacter oscarellae]|uniref:H-type lectin domain-containing protein n=1 Tax=Candidatus Rhodobacter oscarellae TaxID=1675527 RepID=UPI0034DD1FC5